ncbi:hypothetical protein H6G96_02305 [Nostoc sp. FACHB-892]|uniref:hypothetical protein n=1 Tax=Nostoc sp. FACHB-892 TaxID=2692843 RepID=UPI001687179B|nr:hypothetical protein [Nostoc sp. FACHB-892]MBD2725187.1 hypothetical protein [Nostoc sp. FACHB-892]
MEYALCKTILFLVEMPDGFGARQCRAPTMVCTYYLHHLGSELQFSLSELETSTFELGTSTSELGTSTSELRTSTSELETSTSELKTSCLEPQHTRSKAQ